MTRPVPLAAFLTFPSPTLCANETPKTFAEDAPASKSKLASGSPAPALKPEKWLKGDPVTSFETGKVYLIDCWATWCGPCLARISRMNDLHQRFKDQGLVVIGMNMMGDTEEKALAIVSTRSEKMSYRVAYDGKSRQVARDWLEAADIRGIPHAFLIREGNILWHGHPSGLNVDNLRIVMNGGKFAELPRSERLHLEETVVNYRKARLEILTFLRADEVSNALASIRQNEAALSKTDPADPFLLRGMAYSIRGDRQEAISHYQKAIMAANGDAGALFRVANGLMNYGRVRDHQLALQCAREAARKESSVFILQLLARAENAAGNTAAAISIMEKITMEDDNRIYRDKLVAIKGGDRTFQAAAQG
jgi:thiol-disulfide isomerase/thioredoxin